MVIGVPRETAEGERRVALVPETVGKLVKSGASVAVERGAGSAASFLDSAYEEAGATLENDAAALYGKADLVVKVQRPSAAELALTHPGQTLIALLAPLGDPASVEALRRAQDQRVEHGRDSTHHARASNGRALVASQHRRLQSRAHRGELASALFPDVDDGRRNDPAGESPRPRRRRRGSASDRDGAPLGRRRERLRHALGGEGAGAEPRGNLPRARPGRRGRRRGRLRQGAWRRTRDEAASSCWRKASRSQTS